jgi:hypothetical protein
MGRPAHTAAHQLMGRREGDVPRPAQRIGQRDETSSTLSIGPRTPPAARRWQSAHSPAMILRSYSCRRCRRHTGR